MNCNKVSIDSTYLPLLLFFFFYFSFHCFVCCSLFDMCLFVINWTLFQGAKCLFVCLLVWVKVGLIEFVILGNKVMIWAWWIHQTVGDHNEQVVIQWNTIKFWLSRLYNVQQNKYSKRIIKLNWFHVYFFYLCFSLFSFLNPTIEQCSKE